MAPAADKPKGAKFSATLSEQIGQTDYTAVGKTL
jgi:hypothetical protein